VSRDRRVLVTGAGGFIGRWSVAPLVRAGFDVHAVLSSAAHRGTPAELADATTHIADLLEQKQVDALLARVRPTHLLHFAWIATPGIYWTSAQNMSWLAASEYLLQGFRRQGGIRAVMAGSCAEYDWSRAQLCDERETPLADQASAAPTPYAACKIAMHRALADFGQREDLSTAWGRIFFQFGPYEHPDRFVPSVIRHLLLNQEAPCSHGRQVRSFLHVSDVGAAFAKLLHSDVEGAVNIGSDERTTVAELAERIAQQIGRTDLLRMGARPSLHSEPPLLVPSIGRLRDEVGWRPRFALNDGLTDAIDWWRIRLRQIQSAERQR
jgi:nucleoside-diphosphate-sugar epimerase